MPKVKVPRKSTSIDMTAMCDVAFLLLSFFILTTKFKASDNVEVTTPKSVSTKAVEDKNVVLLTMDKEGKVYFSVSEQNEDEKGQIIDAVDQTKGLGLSDAQKAAFVKRGDIIIGVPFSKLKSYLSLTADQAKNYKAYDGIPFDSTNNELELWIRASTTAFRGSKMNLFLKGDNNAKYPSFKGIIDALKKNEIFKFSMITDPEGVPAGTDLYNTNQKRGNKEAPAED